MCFGGWPSVTIADALAYQQLPIPPTPLIGREREIDALCALLQQPDVRLVTLTDPGEVGKMRLAIAVAERMQDAFPDGAVFVPLQALTDPDLALPTIARALGVHETGGRSPAKALGAALGERLVCRSR
jgi:hypothetical protein